MGSWPLALLRDAQFIAILFIDSFSARRDLRDSLWVPRWAPCCLLSRCDSDVQCRMDQRLRSLETFLIRPSVSEFGLPRFRRFMKLFFSNLFESQPRDLVPSCIQLVTNTDALCSISSRLKFQPEGLVVNDTQLTNRINPPESRGSITYPLCSNCSR